MAYNATDVTIWDAQEMDNIDIALLTRMMVCKFRGRSGIYLKKMLPEHDPDELEEHLTNLIDRGLASALSDGVKITPYGQRVRWIALNYDSETLAMLEANT